MLSKKSTGIKVWQLPHTLHCSIIGTCLTMTELKKIAAKGQLLINKNISDYDLHRVVISAAEYDCKFSRDLQKHLNDKYAISIRKLKALKKESEYMDYWNQACEESNMAGALWALMQSAKLSNEKVQQIYGEVHMMSHLAGSQERASLQKTKKILTKNRKLEKKARQDSQFYNDILQDKRNFEKKVVVQKLEIEKLKEELLNIHSTKVLSLRKDNVLLLKKIRQFQEKQQLASELAERWKTLALKTENRNLSLEQAIVSLEKNLEDGFHENNPLRDSQYHGSACPVDSNNNCDGKDEDLCGDCVLYVGGRNKAAHVFNQIVKKRNGTFLHHDGGREDNIKYLESMLSRADRVLCPLDCVSHDACSRIKAYCTKNKKPLVFLPKQSVSAFKFGLKA